MTKFLKQKKGFTLIELLVVVAVIGILASVILVGVASFRGRGRDSRRIGDLRQLQNALELCFSKVGSYPAALTDLTSATCGIGVNQIPKDPTSASNYAYCTTGTPANRYVLRATLEEENPAIRDQVGVTYPCSAGGTACSNVATGKEYCVTI